MVKACSRAGRQPLPAVRYVCSISLKGLSMKNEKTFFATLLFPVLALFLCIV